MNKSAQSLGKLALGKSKKFTTDELMKRKARLALARKRRWIRENNEPEEQ